MTDLQISQKIESLAEQRGVRKTFCPSEVARALAEDWRPLMDQVRSVAAQLISEGKIEACQRGQPVDIDTARGPIRLRAIDLYSARD